MICFVCPNPGAFISGGNLYNQRLIKALAGRGWNVQRVDAEAFPPMAATKEVRFYFFDSLYLEQLPALLDKVPSGAVKGLLCHYLPGIEQPEASPRHFSWSWLSEALDVAVVPSRFLARLLVRYGGWKADSVWEVPPLLEVPPATGTEKRRQPPLVLLAGNYLPIKGVLPFLQILEKKLDLSSEIPGFEVLSFGSTRLDPDYAAACRRLVERSLLLAPRVTLNGAIPPAELFMWYRSAHLFVSPSSFETYGMAVAEALAVGLPVLAMDGGNVKYLLSGSDKGLLFSELEKLVEELLQKVSKPSDTFFPGQEPLQRAGYPIQDRDDILRYLENRLRDFE